LTLQTVYFVTVRLQL